MKQGFIDLALIAAYLLTVWALWRTWKYVFARHGGSARDNAGRVHDAASRPAASRADLGRRASTRPT